MSSRDRDMETMAHLMRRAGFGATRSELEEHVARGYEATVEKLLNPGEPNNLPDDVLRRYHVDMGESRFPDTAGAYWMYRMVTTENPLEEKIALFWHGLFATGYAKLNQARSLLNQIEMFRRVGLGSFRDLLVELSKDPAMLVWLDNNDNHNGAINENYGRELLELFSMGIGNYTEQDIKEASRAFTGWTLGNAEYMVARSMKDSIWPYGRISWHFDFREWDHDDGEKTFLGETGNWNGDDIIDIIAKQSSSAEFACRRLFQFFAADEVDGEGEEVVAEMMRSYFESGYEIRSVLRTLFNSDYFKSERSMYKRVKAPVEVVVGAVRIAGSYRKPTLGAPQLASQAFFMGQGLLMPPTVEGWHEGGEWIDSGALVERVNFAAQELRNVDLPGVQDIIYRLAHMNGGTLTPSELVDGCLDLMGPIQVSDETREALTGYVAMKGDVPLRDGDSAEGSANRVGEVLGLISATREYQLA